MLRTPVILLGSAILIGPAPALAANPVIITQAKAEAGGVTPGDAPGFPVTLTRSGAYELGSNLQPPGSLRGLQIAAPDVTIDFAGYRLFGNDRAEYGVISPYPGITLKNGTIAAFRLSGVATPYNPNVPESGKAWTIQNMRIISNGENGVGTSFGPERLRVIDSEISENEWIGVTCTRACHIENNTISGNGQYGVYISISGTVLGNTITSNVSYGMYMEVAIGYGNNTLFDNNSRKEQVFGGTPLQPNACTPSPC